MVLRDMLIEAFSHGVAIDSIEDMVVHKGGTYTKFTLANSINYGSNTYQIPELVKAYQQIVPPASRLNFLEHMQVFLRWMAVRYQSPEFRSSVRNRLDHLMDQHKVLVKEADDAEAAYTTLRRQRPPPEAITLGHAQARWTKAVDLTTKSMHEIALEKGRPTEAIWERIQREAADVLKHDSRQEGLRRSANLLREAKTNGDSTWEASLEMSVSTLESMLSTPEQLALAQAWSMGLSGNHPLPPKVMALFDLLVHDALLTSWHDHLLSSSLYFKTRATDKFGETDYLAEAEQVKASVAETQRLRRENDPSLVVPQ